MTDLIPRAKPVYQKRKGPEIYRDPISGEPRSSDARWHNETMLVLLRDTPTVQYDVKYLSRIAYGNHGKVNLAKVRERLSAFVAYAREEHQAILCSYDPTDHGKTDWIKYYSPETAVPEDQDKMIVQTGRMDKRSNSVQFNLLLHKENITFLPKLLEAV